MYEQKTTLPSLRNIDWRTVKRKLKKINNLLRRISTNNIKELNELIYAGTKLVCEKKMRLPKKHEQKLKIWLENSTGNVDKKFTTASKNNQTKEKRWNEIEIVTQLQMAIILEEIIKKVLVKEERYCDGIKQ